MNKIFMAQAQGWEQISTHVFDSTNKERHTAERDQHWQISNQPPASIASIPGGVPKTENLPGWLPRLWSTFLQCREISQWMSQAWPEQFLMLFPEIKDALDDGGNETNDCCNHRTGDGLQSHHQLRHIPVFLLHPRSQAIHLTLSFSKFPSYKASETRIKRISKPVLLSPFMAWFLGNPERRLLLLVGEMRHL